MKKVIIVLLVVLILLVLGMGGYLVYDKVLSRDEAKEENIEETQEEIQKDENEDQIVSSNNNISGQYYLFDDDFREKRYYLALDNPDMTNDVQDEDKKTYLVDMKLSNSQPAVKEIDLKSLFKPLYDKKINNLPTILAEGTTNEMPKSKCERYSIKYGDANGDYMVDWSKGVVFTVYYSCIFTEGSSKASMGLGSEIYMLNVDSMQVTFVASND